MQNILLNNLLKAKGETCVSIIIPTHTVSHERKGDKIEVKKAVERAKEDLKRHTTPADFKSYQATIDEWVKNIDYAHNLEGLGMFLSPTVKEIVHFPFPVKEKVMISDSFEIRDIVYMQSFSAPYYVLHLSEKSIRLLRGSLDKLEEIHDDNFPDVFEDTHEYEKPSRGSSHSMQAFSTEGDKSTIVEMRLGKFFQAVDKHLSPYLVNKTPLIIIAPTEEIALFEHETKHRGHIIATIKGNYHFMNPAQLSELAFPAYVRYIKSRTLELINEYEDSISFNLGIKGIHNVWQAVKTGRGRKLVVEKDFVQEAYLQKDGNQLFFKAPEGAHTVTLDIIDDTIETMFAKGGEVYLTDNDVLKDYGRMFLIARY